MIWHKMPSLAALRGFESAVRNRSFSGAARELNVTHAAVAQHVRNLETHLGQSLLIKEGRQMVPTAAGQKLARDLTIGFEGIIASVSRLQEVEKERPLQISCTPNFAENWLMPRLVDFWASHPDTKLAISPSNDIVDLRNSGTDIALRYGAGNWPGTRSVFLAGSNYAAVVHPDLLGGRKPKCLSELTDVPWLFCPHLPVYRAWAEQSGLDMARVTERSLASMSMITAAVRAGAGASVVIKAVVEAEIADGKLYMVEQAHQPGLGYYVVTSDSALSDKVKTFRKWLLSQRET